MAAFGADTRATAQQKSPGAGPIIVLETAKGTIEFETYPEEAPKTVARIVELVKKGFYNGLRFHRAEPNFLVQIGDPEIARHEPRGVVGAAAAAASRSASPRSPRSAATRSARVGDGASRHRKAQADSQFYIMRRAAPELDGKYTVFGQVLKGHGRRREDPDAATCSNERT